MAQDFELTWEKYQNQRGELMKFLFDKEAVKPDWGELRDNMPFEQKKRILLTLGREEFYTKQLDGKYKEEYASHYYFVDLNKDGQKDIVYNAADGADAALLMIWLNDNGSYKLVLNQPGDILFVNWTSSTFLVDQPAFFGEKIGHLMKYQVTKSSVLNEKYVYQEGIYLPGRYIDIANFRTLNDNYNLRSSPKVMNQPCEEYPDGSDLCGNLYVALNRGIEGSAIAEERDETGRVSWLSVVHYERQKILGWMSSRYVEKY